MTLFSFLRACSIGLAVATVAAATPAFADPVTVALFGTAFANTFAGAVVTFIITTGISPSSLFSGDVEHCAMSSAPPRLHSITPIGKGGRSIGPFMIARATGDCMGATVGDMAYLLIDKRLAIRRNDLVTLALRAGPMAGSIITKRFVEAYSGAVSVAQSYPRLRIDFGFEEIEWAYRVRAMSPSLIGAFWLMLLATVRPRSLNERLGGGA